MSTVAMINGGPAFPIVLAKATDARTGAVTDTDVFTGLSVWDHYAGQALIGLLASGTYSNSGPGFEEFIAVRAGLIADAMLSARSRQMGLNVGGEA